MNRIRLFLISAVLMLGGSLAAFGQATVTTTTNSVAIGAFDTSVTLASVTGVNAPGFGASNVQTILFVDKEAMYVNTVNTTTLIVGVTRGYAGTKAVSHLVTSTVYVGTPNYFITTGNGFGTRTGSCTSSNEVALPRIDVAAGKLYTCQGASGSQVWAVEDLQPVYGAVFTGGATTGSSDIFPFIDTASNTGTGNVVSVQTATGSSEKALTVLCGAQSSAASPSNGSTCFSLTSGAGGASTSAGTAGGNGGLSQINTGAGGAGASTGTGGVGGELDVLTGTGGAASGSGATGGNGGLLKILAGAGGGTITGGTGGAITETAGAGGAGSTTAGTGGAVTITGGAGPSTAGTSGVGGATSLTGGAGSANTASAGTGGAGGASSLVGGVGGAASTGAATGGAGGAVNVTGGAGGGTITGGAGGLLTLGGGNGANGSTAGGAGGGVTINGGNAGTGGTPAGGVITLVPGTPTSTGATGFVVIAGAAAGAHFNTTQTTKPAASGTCTTPAVATGSTDAVGQVSAASCTSTQTVIATFNKPYGTAPFCTCSAANTGGATTASAAAIFFCSASTTALTLTSPAASSSTPAWNYVCSGSN